MPYIVKFYHVFRDIDHAGGAIEENSGIFSSVWIHKPA